MQIFQKLNVSKVSLKLEYVEEFLKCSNSHFQDFSASYNLLLNSTNLEI
jgi:hypothetical protein